MTVDLPGLAQILEASLDPTQNKQGSILSPPASVLPRLTRALSGACYPARREAAQLLTIFAANRGHTNLQSYCSPSRCFVLQKLH